jgi:taurine dioxygenase
MDGGSNSDFMVRRLGGPLGAEIVGLDLSKPIDEATFRRVEAAFHEHCVVVYRDQHLDADQHVAFTKRWGEPTAHVLKQYHHPRHPEMLVLSNIVENGKPLGISDAGQYWHSDMSYTGEPPRCSILHGIEVPFDDAGNALGDTLFVNTVAAYEALDDETKRRIAGLHAKHDYQARYARQQATGNATRVELDDDQKKSVPAVVHPVVRTHPFTGKKALYVSEGFTVELLGLPKDEGDRLLARLCAHVTEPRFLYTHKWRPHDVLMWDNASTQHNAVPNYGPQQRRLMERTTVRGTPVF